MAYTRIHPIKTTLNKALAYIENPDKTSGYMLVSGYNCDPVSASLDFAMTVELAERVSGNYTKTGGANVLAEHMIQSFSYDDKITPEQAHEIGKKWADEITAGKHEYVITTHIDKGHIHNHIIFNATSFYDYKKFENYKIAAHLREVSDRLCMEYGLEIIKNPKLNTKSPSQYEYQQKKKGLSWKEQVRQSIDKAIENTTDFASFRAELLKDGIEILDGKRITFHKIGVESENGRAGKVRGDRIGEDYTRERITERLSEPKTKERKRVFVTPQPEQKEAAPATAQRPAERQPVFASYDKQVEWEARKTQLAATKELAAALMTIRKEQVTQYADFDNKLAELRSTSDTVRGTIKTLDDKNTQYKNAAKYLLAYNQYLPVYQELQKQSIFSKSKYETKYSGELAAFKFAAEQLEKMGVNTTVDPNKVIALVREQDSRASELAGNLRQVEERISQLRKAQEIVRSIQSDEQQKEQQRRTERGATRNGTSLLP